MEETRMDPLTRLHKLQEEEFGRFLNTSMTIAFLMRNSKR